MAESDRPSYWEAADLDPDGDLSSLASYVNIDQLIGSGLVPEGRIAERIGARKRAVSDAARELAGKRVRYAHGAVGRGGHQVVRHLQRILREGGTCLDLAVLFAAQLLKLELRPHLVLLYPSALAAGADAHALVLVDLHRRRVDSDLRWPDGRTGSEGRPVHELDVKVLPEGWLVCDPAVLTAGALPADVGRAIAEGERRLRDAQGRVWLVDVAAAQSTAQGAPLTTPQENVNGLLTSRLPSPVPGWVPFESHKELREGLRTGPSAVVLTGESGRGKSTIARDVAAKAAHGCGWFLNGSSESALKSALAEQEGVERNLPREAVAADVDGWAEAALSRLRESPAPWAVVVDNADLDPMDIKKWLPKPDPERGQRLVVTSTEANPWRAHAEKSGWLTWEAVPALDPADIKKRLGIDVAPEGAATLPLMVSALERLAEAASEAGSEVDLVEITSADDPILSYWRAVVGVVGVEQAPRTRQLGRTAAMLPADRVPLSVHERLLGESAEADLGRMAEWGMLTIVDGHWSVHRLIAKAIRDDDNKIAMGELACRALADDVVRRYLVSAFDQDVIGRLREALSAADGVDLAAAFEGLMLILDEKATAEASANAAEEALKYVDGALHPRMRANCLLGCARFVNQHQKTMDVVALQVALGQAREAQALAEPVDPLLAAKAKAMVGLLLKHVAMANRDLVEQRAGLQHAYELIIAARDERTRLCAGDPNDLDLAKAVFNVSGVSLQMAKAHRDSDPNGYLDDALYAYEVVEKARRAVLGNIPHRHAAACTHGRGLICYYRAIMVKDLSLSQRTVLLREATDHLQRSLAERQILEPDGDDEDVRKTLHVLTKVMVARRVVSDLVRHRSGLEVFEKGADSPTIPEVRDELEWVLLAESHSAAA